MHHVPKYGHQQFSSTCHYLRFEFIGRL